MKMAFALCSLRNFLPCTTEMTALGHSLHLQLGINSGARGEAAPELSWPNLPGVILAISSPWTSPSPLKLQGTLVWGSLAGFYHLQELLLS